MRGGGGLVFCVLCFSLLLRSEMMRSAQSPLSLHMGFSRPFSVWAHIAPQIRRVLATEGAVHNCICAASVWCVVVCFGLFSLSRISRVSNDSSLYLTHTHTLLGAPRLIRCMQERRSLGSAAAGA